MKRIAVILGIFFINAPAITGAVHADDYDWRPSLTVNADIDRDGKMDSAQLGIADERIGLLVTLNLNPLPVIDIPVDG